MFCRVHFVFGCQVLFSSTVTFRLQRWSPRRHILKSLSSKLQVLENFPFFSSTTAVCLESLKFCRSFFVEKNCFLRSPEKKFLRPSFLKTREKNFRRSSFFGEHWRLCPCPRKGLSSKELSLASDIFLCPWPRALCPLLHLCPVSV